VSLINKNKCIKEFEDYLNQITESLSLSIDEKNELKEEWLQHLIESKDHFLQKGIIEQEAIQQAMKQFGGVEKLQSELKRSMVSLQRLHFLKELVIWLICLLATIMGPSLLIGAYFQVYFILFPLFLLFCCYVIYHIMIKRGKHLIIPILGLPIAYIAYASYYVSRDSWAAFFKNIFNLHWNSLFGGYGLFNSPSLHLLWIMMIISILFVQRSNKKKWQSMIRGSYEYWFMIMIAMFIVTKEWLDFSNEMIVILLNVFLLYGLLQQIVVPARIQKSISKLEYFLRKATKERV
jgi:hypothetical protein